MTIRGMMVAAALLAACAGDTEPEQGRPDGKPVVWDCECIVATHADAFGIPVQEHMERELQCASANPSDDDCACEKTATRCEPDAGM